MGAKPSETSVKRLKGKVRTLLKPCEKGSWPEVRDRLNKLLIG
jgi:RNA-directed DNA polymerase